ncbi:hypothetical protein QBC43DRAFT_203978 [Cladorrhinum sp. PSN259]|nr:hypothetical protein QBC43DRAFT_203978 [Cladorrhinum sp. PSN259]
MSKLESVFTRDSYHTIQSRAPEREPVQILTLPTQSTTRQPRPISLWCEFGSLLDCNATFQSGDERGWIQHHLEHLCHYAPMQSMCWFCDNVRFHADGQQNAHATFRDRMMHIRQEILDNPGLRADHTRPDFDMIRHLRQVGGISETMYQHAMAYNEPSEEEQPPGPSSSFGPYFTPRRGDGAQDIIARPSRWGRQRERDGGPEARGSGA